MATTPFSINDILTKNNTTIFRRRFSSGELSPMSQSNENMSDPDYQSSEELQQTKSSKLFKHSKLDQLQSKTTSNREHYVNRENVVRQLASSPSHDGRHGGDRNITKRRGSLDCFLIDGNHNNTERDGISKNAPMDRKTPVGADHHMKIADHHMNIGYYNYPMVVESPLDMRRCANDSGKC